MSEAGPLHLSVDSPDRDVCEGRELSVTIVCLSADRYNLIVSTTLIMIVQTMPNNT